MTPEDRKLLQQLRDALNHAIRSHFPPRWDNTEPVLGYKSLIAAADARLSQPVQSHEAWVDRGIELAKDFGLNDFRNHAEKYLRAHLNNHPAAGI